MIPILYSPTETKFDHNGIGPLTDCILCDCTEERNGAFELELQYPMQGRYFSQIQKNSVIKARADDERDPQLFRVSRNRRLMPGVTTSYLKHISYDLLGMPVSPFTATSAAEAMQLLRDNIAVPNCPFSFETDIDSTKVFTNPVPVSARACLGRMLETYGGELEFDNFTVRLHKSRGKDRGVTVRYGKNLTSFEQDENCSAVYSGLYPYWTREETVDGKSVTTYVELDEKVIMFANGPNDKVLPLDLSREFKETPTQDQLKAAARAYADEHNLFVPEVSMNVSFALLRNTEEYKNLQQLETVSLCDTVTVIFPEMDVSAGAKAVKTVYDGLREQPKSVTLGSIKATIADTIAAQNSAIKAVSSAGIGSSINATDINLYGSFTVKNGDTVGGRLGYMSGMTGDGTVTNGIGVRNADGTCTIIVTDAGVSMRGGNGVVFVSGGNAVVSGDTVTIAGKTVRWNDNGDGTYTLMA